MQTLEQLLNQVSALNQIAHEHKQRDGDQNVAGHDREGTLNHQS